LLVDASKRLTGQEIDEAVCGYEKFELSVSVTTNQTAPVSVDGSFKYWPQRYVTIKRRRLSW
jgi:hypothetical protein